MNLVRPFIKLEDPVYRNIPDKSETQGFERYMEQRVKLKESLGARHIGQNYFPQKDPDDLAQVFEVKLAESCARRTTLTYEVGEDNPTKMTESEIRREMSAVIRDHLKRTNGNIGHFPYSGERLIMQWISDDKEDTYDVRLDPFSIYWADASLGDVEATAKKNDVRKTEKDRDPDLEATSRSSVNYKFLFLISAVLSVAALLGTLAVKQTGNVWLLLLASNFVIVFPIIACICLILMIRDSAKRKRSAGTSYAQAPEDRFQTHVAVRGIGWERSIEHYDKERFAREVQELHAYFVFLRLWSENTGRELPVLTRVKIERFYEYIAPFIISEKRSYK